MRNGILALLLFFFSISPALAAGSMLFPLAGEMEVTSDFGWRTHPIFGTQKFHSGIDFAAEEGETVYAAEDGVVSTAGWISGYGYTVILQHGEGMETLYGHNSELLVSGGFVHKGDPIALAGSTGNSTGPHCHFEVNLNGEPVSPWDYLNGTPHSGSGGFFQSDFNFLPMDFDVSVDFAKPLRDALSSISTQATNGLDFIRNSMGSLFLALLAIDFAFAALWGMFKTVYNPNTGESATPEGYIHWLIRRSLFYGLLIFLYYHWPDWFVNFIMDFFTDMGSGAMGETVADVGEIVSDPTKIVQKGVTLIAPAFSYAGSFSAMTFLANLSNICLTLLLAFAILLCFLGIGIQIGLAYLEFYVVSLFAFTMFCFSSLAQTRHYGNYAINAVITVGVKLMFFCIFSAMLTFVIQNLTVDDFFEQGTLAAASQENGQKFNAAGSSIQIEQFMAAIRQVESHGDYTIPSEDGYGYGAYQISYSNWDAWCAEAGIQPPAEWTPENQDKVARVKMLQYYETYGNWHDVAVAWNGGCGAVGEGWAVTEEYAQKVQAAIGQPLQKSIKFVLLLEILLVTLLFCYFGSKMNRLILTLFGGKGGFRLSAFEGENDKFI